MVRIILASLVFGIGACACRAGVLRQDAYVWQRSWSEPVTNSLVSHADRFGEIIVLKAEVTWSREGPRCTEVALDYRALRSVPAQIGIALRIGRFAGPFQPDDAKARYLAHVSKALVDEVRAGQINPVELQLDFDCADSRLEGYRVWLETIQSAVWPVPVTITALPSWLHRPEVRGLLEAADGYVLQIHSFERPHGPTSTMTLCDPSAGKDAVITAAAIGRSFRVALPTYGYVTAFDEEGQFLGLSAEGQTRQWPTAASLVEVRANPVELSRLVGDWMRSCPQELTGIIWYRLPVAGETLNWRWPTLDCVMNGTLPAPRVVARTDCPAPGLVEVMLSNNGTADADSLPLVNVRWQGSRRLGADAIGGYELAEASANTVQFRPVDAGQRLPAGENRKIGWVRLESESDLDVELQDERD